MPCTAVVCNRKQIFLSYSVATVIALLVTPCRARGGVLNSQRQGEFVRVGQLVRRCGSLRGRSRAGLFAIAAALVAACSQIPAVQNEARSPDVLERIRSLDLL